VYYFIINYQTIVIWSSLKKKEKKKKLKFAFLYLFFTKLWILRNDKNDKDGLYKNEISIFKNNE